MAEWRHEQAHLAIGGHLIEAEPRSDIRDVYRPGEVSDGVQILRQGLHSVGGNAESGEVDFTLTELELLRVEEYAGVSGGCQEVNGSSPMIREV